MRLPRLDVVFGLTAPAITILIKQTGVALPQISDDEARGGSLGAGLDARDDPLDAPPACGPIVKLAVTAGLAMTWRGIEAGFHAGFEVPNVAAQCRGRRDAENVFEPLGTTEVENFGTAIMAVAAQHYPRLRPV